MIQTAQSTEKLSDIFNSICSQLEGKMTENFGEIIIDVNNKLGQGYVRGTQVLKNKLFLEFNLKMNEDVTISLAELEFNPVHFFYCEKSSVAITVGHNYDEKELNEFQTAILSDKIATTNLNFKADQHIKASVISVCKPYAETQFSEVVKRIHERFQPQKGTMYFYYKGSYNVKVATTLAEIQQIQENELVRKLYLDGLVQMILAMEIKHHTEDMINENEINGKLNRKELAAIKEMGERIKMEADLHYNVEEISMELGIPAAKLQEGFKHLFGRTVTDYIKHVRLEIAEELLKTTDLTISEVVYTIGFSSRSYFSKIFKEKYHCSPKSFQDSIKQRAISA